METFDYIVIGAGSAGCVVAARLSERVGTSVLLLEAGGADSHPTLKMPVAFLKAVINPAFNWGYMTEPEPCLGGRRLWLPRGRVLGGSGSTLQTSAHCQLRTQSSHAKLKIGWRTFVRVIKARFNTSGV